MDKLKKKILIAVLVVSHLLGNGGWVVLAQEATGSGEVLPVSIEETLTPTEEPVEEIVTPTEEPVQEVTPEVGQELEEPVDQINIDDFPLVEEPEVLITPAMEIQASAQLRQPQRVRPLSRGVYRAGEKVSVVVDNAQASEVSLRLYNSDGQEIEAEVEIANGNSPAILKISLDEAMKPGRYRLVIVDGDGNTTVQDFAWGVLAINFNKTIYAPNETAHLSIAVLDEGGLMVCDADLYLRIRKIVGTEEDYEMSEEELSTENGDIWVNPECIVKAYVEKSDYEADYVMGEAGRYEFRLKAVTENGEYTIEDETEVRESVPFDIERIGHTRLFPPVNYPMKLTITAFEDFEGEIVETVPGSFAISSLEGVEGYERIEVEQQEIEVSEGTIFGLVPPFDGSYPISSYFGQMVRDPTIKSKYDQYGVAGHDGVDFDMPIGTPVLSVDDGEVVKAQINGDYGNTVVIQHSWGRSYYGHLSEVTAQVGKKINKGFPMGLSGNSGLSTGPHLHFGIKPTINDVDNGFYGKINPLPYLFIREGNQEVLDEISREEESRNYVLSGISSTGVQQIVWQVSMKTGEEITLGYAYKVPSISPQFYLVGPLVMRDESGMTVFAETRQWQLAIDADGSGTNTVDPTIGTTDATGKTYTFTFTAAETMDSGEFTISVPAGWSEPQGGSGTAGYTTAVGNSTATVGTMLNSADSITNWTLIDTDFCNTLVVDTGIKKEGTGSIVCDNDPTSAGPDNNDAFGYDYGSGQDWSGYTQVSYWIYATAPGIGSEFTWGSGADLNGTALGVCAMPTLSASTWTYVKCTLSGILTTVQTFGFSCTSPTCTPFETGDTYIDELLIGPGLPTFSGSGPWTISARVLDAANTETFTVVYGSGGGTSGVTNHTVADTYIFATQSKILLDGVLTNISSNPTVVLSEAAAGPTMDQVMRHGTWFDSGVEQPFTF